MPQVLWRSIQKKIQSAPCGISEFEILKDIDKENYPFPELLNFKSPGTLFPIHFALFHKLYCWQRELSDSKAPKTLVISPLQIHLRPHSRENHNNELSQELENTPLRQFYLDTDNLYRTTEEDLDEMLQSFWRRVIRSDHIVAALDTLGLNPKDIQYNENDYKIIKRTYKRMAMEHHPDRGGSLKQSQKLNEAMQVLRVHFKSLNSNSP
ncbi:MAG: hypothetical protein MI864_27045 [Pseudomonadales bacterium]|nr:hypothetical protein [Pseudomonadales bacterium]